MNKLIVDTLKPLNVPVSFATYNQTVDTYVVFLEYNQMSAMQADDDEYRTVHYFQVDIFSKGNYGTLTKQVKSLMKQAGFKRMFESETYEEDMKKFRKILRFSYITKGEN